MDRKSGKFLYGNIIHLLVEDISLPKFKSIQELKSYLHSKTVYLPDNILKMVWRRLSHIYKYKQLHNRIKELIHKGYEYHAEKSFAYITKRGRIKFIRPDMILVNRNKKHIILIEIKSGAHFRVKQLEMYIKVIEGFYYIGWTLDVYVYLVKKDKLKRYKRIKFN